MDEQRLAWAQCPVNRGAAGRKLQAPDWAARTQYAMSSRTLNSRKTRPRVLLYSNQGYGVVVISVSIQPATSDLRVLVVAGDPLARAGLSALLAEQVGLEVVGQTGGEDGLDDVVEVYRPDVVLWDMGWETSDANHLDDLQELGPPVVALIADPTLASEAWASGARGVLPRDAGPAVIDAALKAVVAGLTVMAPEMSPQRAKIEDRAPLPLVEQLTPRETEVLQLLAQGLPNKTIADRLNVSEHTVKFHVNAILGKLGVQSRTEAVILATRLGLVLL